MFRIAAVTAAFALAGTPFAAQAEEGPIVALIAAAEGPTLDRQGNLYFTELFSDRIMKVSPAGALTVFRADANGANGLVIDGQDRMIAAERGAVSVFGAPADGTVPRVTRTDLATGQVEVLADSHQGKPLVFPNDVTFDGKGRIYFTDMLAGTFYRIDRPGAVAQLVAPGSVKRPNGIQISPDDKTLYIIDSPPGAGEPRVIRRYDLLPDGSVANMSIHYDFKTGRGGDGASVDSVGNLYVSAGMNRRRGTPETADNRTGIYVISPEGRLLKFIPVSQDYIFNNTFGGPDMKTLYVAAGGAIIKMQNDVPGLPR